MSGGHGLNKPRSSLLSHQWKHILVACMAFCLHVNLVNRRETISEAESCWEIKNRFGEKKKGRIPTKTEGRGQMYGCVMIHQSLIWQRRLWTCEGSYGGDDLLEAAMSGILLSMCLPGSVTFDFNPPPNTCEAHPKWSWQEDLKPWSVCKHMHVCAFKLMYSIYYHLIIVSAFSYMHLYIYMCACVCVRKWFKMTQRCSAEERPSWFSLHRIQCPLPAMQSLLKLLVAPPFPLEQAFTYLYNKPALQCKLANEHLLTCAQQIGYNKRELASVSVKLQQRKECTMTFLKEKCIVFSKVI